MVFLYSLKLDESWSMSCVICLKCNNLDGKITQVIYFFAKVVFAQIVYRFYDIKMQRFCLECEGTVPYYEFGSLNHASE